MGVHSSGAAESKGKLIFLRLCGSQAIGTHEGISLKFSAQTKQDSGGGNMMERPVSWVPGLTKAVVSGK